MDFLILAEPPSEPLGRSVYLTNDEWLILSQCVESFSTTYRDRHSVTIATLLTRGQTSEALLEAQKMNDLLHHLDKLQAKLIS